MKKPILLQKGELIKPIEQALNRIEKIRERKVNNTDSIILEGLFALGVSSFEHSLIDTLRQLFFHIPEKLDFKTDSITKKELINGNPLKQTIENKLNSISYKGVSEILIYFAKITGISENLIPEDELNSLLELKATRNLLMHNDLKINTIYRESAGPNARLNNARLVITQDYLFESIVILKSILRKYKDALSEQYSSFTRTNAIKNLFDYMFPTFIMEFDNEFEINTEEDRLGEIKTETTRKNGLSSSERFLYDVWLSHSHSIKFSFDDPHFYKLDYGSREKLSVLMNEIEIFKS
jgi:hypothetical protein